MLGNDPSGRAAFVHSGGLAAVQQMAEAPGSKLKEAVEIINSAYPEEVSAAVLKDPAKGLSPAAGKFRKPHTSCCMSLGSDVYRA